MENQLHKAAERLKKKAPQPQSTTDVLNKDIARSIIGKSIIRKAAAEKVKPIKIEEEIKQLKRREEASNKFKAAMQTKFTKQYKEATFEHKVKDTGQPLVANQNTKELLELTF